MIWKKIIILFFVILCLVPGMGCGAKSAKKAEKTDEERVENTAKEKIEESVEEKAEAVKEADTAESAKNDGSLNEKEAYDEELSNEAYEEEKENIEAEASESGTIEQNYVYVNAPDGYVNMRTGPGTDYEIICTIPNETALEVYPGDATAENGKKWLKIAYWTDGEWKTGWVSESQVE
ncbi:MAG: SH3 domain-containing protein [Lachnospiraceae bacterium]|nr:SH3 domain-containing protein [Lachnospiraceae bacterium]